MATNLELAERLVRRFKGVPNFDITDAQELVDDSLQVHELDPSADVPNDKTNLVLLYAQAEGAWQIALSTAHYFQYQDGEESVDKSMISEQYRKLAKDLRADYDRAKSVNTGAGFHTAARIDRPHTTPPTGGNRRRRWITG
ncbi:hypothetical protein [Lederbergia citri]|uniref:Uncharacterized protein n=1 Tax=Lederbergia citri TaxID=2833580 RepID=A0A942YH27_9BACI|nr:hypothetical protein [Lederbergia citri]MBS4195334.1 hypothetical protein [Lederbergia citri]